METAILKETWAGSRDRLPGNAAPEVDYSLLSSRQRSLLSDNEREGHALLSRYGFRVTVLPVARSAAASIDMMLDGEYWELKSPVGTGARLRTRISEGVSKWERLHDAGELAGSTPKIVLDNRFSSMDDDAALGTLEESIAFYAGSGFDEALFVSKGGTLTRLRKQEGPQAPA